MAALNTLAAGAAAAHLHVEPAVDDPAGDLGLILLGRVGVKHLARPAGRAGGGQRGLVRLVDPPRGGAAGLDAVVVAALAARLLRVGLGRPLGERGGLTLAAATQLLDQRLERRDAGFQVGDPLRRRDAAGALRVESRLGLHATRYYAARRRRCGGGAKQLQEGFVQPIEFLPSAGIAFVDFERHWGRV